MSQTRFYHADNRELLFADVGMQASVGAVIRGGVDGIPDRRFVVTETRVYEELGEREHDILFVEEGET